MNSRLIFVCFVLLCLTVETNCYRKKKRKQVVVKVLNRSSPATTTTTTTTTTPSTTATTTTEKSTSKTVNEPKKSKKKGKTVLVKVVTPKKEENISPKPPVRPPFNSPDQSFKNKVKTSIKKKIWEKLKQVKSTEDILKFFDPEKKIKYRKVKVVPKIRDLTFQDGYVFENMVDPAIARGQVARDEVAQSETVVFEDNGCKPRPKIVSIPIALDGAYWPACVEIRQCGGCCSHSLFDECKPVSLKNESTQVWKIRYSDGVPSVHNIYLLHHDTCACQCKVDASSCNPGQTFNKRSCKCECHKKPEVCLLGKQWSDIDCGCVCSQQNPSCPLRNYWNKESCRCDCISDPCPKHHTRDPSTCYCLMSVG